MKQLQFRSILIMTVLAVTGIKVTGQAKMPDVLLNNPLKEQMNYLEEHTKIYEDYRAIREDMFQKLMENVNDTLSGAYKNIASLKKNRSVLNISIDSLKKNLATTNTSLDEMTTTKNSIKVLGIQVNKGAYNKMMWTILLGLVALLVIGFLIFKRNLMIITGLKSDLQELKNEFESYRKTSREAREKMTMDHFLEIKRLKGEQ